MTVNVLGTTYSVIKRSYDDDPSFKQDNLIGYCDSDDKTIIIGDISTFKNFKNKTKDGQTFVEKECLRHEIVHAFFYESGLADSTGVCQGPWSQNEEMVDWIAIQGPKIYEAWLEAGAL